MKGRLKEGQVIKNYKELCKILGLKVKAGNSKIAQMKELERYYKFSKHGYKLIVDEVYAETKLKKDARGNNGKHFMKYDNLMDNILINLLLKNNGHIQQTFAKIMKMLKIFSIGYENLNKSGYTTFTEVNKISSPGLTLTYQQKLYNIVEKCMETALRRLKRQGIIEYSKEINILNTDFSRYFADATTIKTLKQTEKKIYKEMGITHQDRIITAINRKFKNKVSNVLGIYTYYNVYNFSLIDKEQTQVEEDKDELIKRLIKSVSRAVRNKKNKADDITYCPYSFPKYQSDIDKLTKLLWILPENYKTDTEIEIEEKIKYYEMYIEKEMVSDNVPF
ncbi:MAG: hypothetical protein QM295_01855 [Bacillota bacterium]|nr:hypothetical protein [Bacillota bacterium]